MRIEYNKTWFVVGRSAEENWKIIIQADKDYYWVHANGYPSSHVIIEIDEPLNDEIQYACQLCINQSKKISKLKPSFIITQIKNIKLGSKPGEVYFKDDKKISHIKFT
jgi:predicted ribosome quality control (RQC) complex YloA/Tae2 family protein